MTRIQIINHIVNKSYSKSQETQEMVEDKKNMLKRHSFHGRIIEIRVRGM